ncbi:MAG: WG repeat-containing protein [Saprospiraceae bacterium]|uniref:WG repeat-containing protein n=1 Tax=Candidatus Opimibacter skivensis TaxID=2982028 RepID=A0A9D7SUS4_9BACT|nr:WG repeat-containing protein [Candidatus Opimibacter skivensis]
MKIINIILISILLGAGISFSQTTVLPFLKNGKYGIADMQGKIIVEPQFEDVRFYSRNKVGAFKKNGLWGIIDIFGKILLPNQVNVKVFEKDERNLDELVNAVFDTAYQNYSGGKYINIQLYKIKDNFAKVEYYVNPYHPVSIPKSFIQTTLRSSKTAIDNSSEVFRTGLVRVIRQNDKINFVDTAGQLILKDDIYDGSALTDRFIVFRDEQNQEALYDRMKNTVTPYSYTRIVMSDNGSFIILNATINKNRYETLLDLEGIAVQNQIQSAGDFSEVFNFNKKYIIVNGFESAILLDKSGNKKFEIPGGQLIINKDDDEIYILRKNNMYGLVDAKGNLVLQPTFDFIEKQNNNYISFNKGNSTGVLDHSGHIISHLDSVHIVYNYSRFPDLFLINRKNEYKYTYGIADISGKIIVQPVYKRIELHASQPLLTVYSDSMSGIFSIEGKEIIPFSKSSKQISSWDTTIESRFKDLIITYDLKGTEVGREYDMNIYLAISHIGGMDQLLDQKGIPVSELYTSIQEKNFVFKLYSHRYYVAKKSTQDKNIYILNRLGQNIVPRDYICIEPNRNSNSDPAVNGAVVVFNEADLLSGKKSFRSGVVDLSGQWLIEPDYQTIVVINRELFAAFNVAQNKSVLYDRKGKLISNEPYILKYNTIESELKYPRVIVTKKAGIKESVLFDKVSPDMVVGVIDLKGKVITPLKYKSVYSYEHSYTIVKGEDKSGAVFSAVIDLNGKEILHTGFDDLYIFPADTTLLMTYQGSRRGIMRITGEEIVGTVWNQIDFLGKLYGDIVFALKDSTNVYAFMAGKPLIHLGTGKSNSVRELKGHYDGISYAENATGEVIQHLIVFDKDGHVYGTYSGFDVNSYPYAKEGYLYISDRKGDLPYVVDFRTGREFRIK